MKGAAEVVGGIVAAFAVAVVAWFLGGRNKSVADTARTSVETAGALVEELRQEVQRLALKVDNLEHDNTRLRDAVSTLDRENVRLRLRVAELEALVSRKLEPGGGGS